MSLFSGKKFLLFGFIVVLLIAIPVTIYLVQQQQKTRSAATPSTNLTLTPASNATTAGENVTLILNVAPGTNRVSFIKFKINYDSTKLATAGAGFELKPWQTADGTNFTPVLRQLVYQDGSIQGAIDVGPSPQYAISAPTQVASITFNAFAPTEAPTTVSFDQSSTEVLSVGGESSSGENVLSSAIPATITIAGGTTTTTTTTTTIPTTTTTTTTIPTTTTTIPTTTPSANQLPVCNTLTVTSSGSAVPVTTTLVANGTDADGTINKVTFNFGDGTTQDVTEGGAIGSNSVNVTVEHIYNSAGTFTASALLTDNNGAQSSSSSCNQAVTIAGGAAATPTSTPTTVGVTITPAPTLPPTGPGQIMLFVGALGAIISAIGVFLLLAL
ncbi:hypothetical protein A2W14_01360 [Candidatus Gottesmanbacteria bacterium RBG_16_37_8]|uniref:PKD domain-containing protein n=1 Tax=Candidatus Gottesmanbacteria bacterium RBG_16_37_8 TaxID=1798371 RepID=A0A1F5YR72_9BACT|nr:MAG: hypothetical protein A2W14_01360 [Candidatus Gottesmanbacteria bacterium RBG_16_37_8]